MATRQWQGTALKRKQVTTITIAGTWAQNDTATLTINGNDLVTTIGTLVTTTQVAATLVQAFNGSSSFTDTSASSLPSLSSVANESGGNSIPEFRRITATSSGAVITLTADDPGVPFTISVSESTASTDGVVGTPSTTTAATGPNFFDNADNWSGDTVPVDGDAIVFDSGDVDCLYNIDQGAVTPASITVTMGYTGKIGLPETNTTDSAFPYREYRTTYLTLGDTGDATNIAVNIGGGFGQGSGRIKLNNVDSQATINVQNTGPAAENGVASFLWKGTHASNEFNVTKGSCGIAVFAGETATVATLRVGYRTNQQGDSSLECGSGVTLTTIEESGGTMLTRSNVTTANIRGGIWTRDAGTLTTLNLTNATCIDKSTGTITTVNAGSGGTYDRTQDMRALTITNYNAYFGSGYRDPNGTITHTNGIDFVQCTAKDLRVFEHKPNVTLSFSAI